MKHYYINVFYSEVDEGYIADIPELGNCSAFGKTLEEALRQVLIAQAALRHRSAYVYLTVPLRLPKFPVWRGPALIDRMSDLHSGMPCKC